MKDFLEENSYDVLHTKLEEFNVFVYKISFAFKDVKKFTTRYVNLY